MIGRNPNESRTTNNPNAGVGNSVAAGTNETGKAIFESNRIYRGTIVNCYHDDQMYDVSLVGKGGVSQRCHWGGGMFSALLGFKTEFLPTKGTQVVVLGGNPPFIIDTLPIDPRDDVSRNSKITTSTDAGASKLRTGDSAAGVHHSYTSDMLEGEFGISNGLGVSLQLLTTLIKLQGSERAKVEAHLLHDMVRIVSETFKHFSCFGDYEIYNDGGLNVRFEGSSREHEAQGLMQKDENKADIDNNDIKFGDNLIDNARWRFSQYIGFLGDFIHVFVTDPSTVASNIGEALRAGKSRFWQGMDGTCLLQSVTEIAIERVIRIPVPQEKKRWDDPTGVLKTAWDSMLEAQSAYTKVWNYGTKFKNIHHAAYQLREYARWLNCFHSYARFHQYDAESGEWYIPKETAIDHSWTNQEDDVASKNSHLDPGYYDTYACIRIMRDGGIVLLDGYGSSVTMSRGSLFLNSPRHIEMDAGGDIKMVAGNDIYLRARRHVELTATKGSIVTKARTAWKALCEWGSIWLKSDAQDPADPSFEEPTLDDVNEDPKPEIHDAAIMLDTVKGRITINSARTLTLQTDSVYAADNESDHTDDSKSVVIQSDKQDVKIVAGRNINNKSIGKQDGVITIDAARSTVLTSPKILLDTTMFDINNKFTINNGGFDLNASIIKAEALYVQSPIYGGEALDEISQSSCCYVPHKNHILISDQDQAPEFAASGDTTDRANYLSTVKTNLKYKTQFDTRDPANGPEWKFYFPDTVDYDWLYTSDEEEERFVPLAQQRIETDSNLTNAYGTWALTNDTLKEAYRTLSSEVPYPGPQKLELEHDSVMVGLHEKLDEEYKDQSPDIMTNLSTRSVSRKFLKVSNNKQ